MSSLKLVHLGVFTAEALELLKKFAVDGVWTTMSDFMQASDNEVVYYNFSTQTLRSPEKIKEIIINALKTVPKTSDDYFDVIKLIHILEGVENLTEAEKRLMGESLDPFRTNAIEVLEDEIVKTRVDYMKKLNDLEKERDQKIEDLKLQIKELRKQQWKMTSA